MGVDVSAEFWGKRKGGWLKWLRVVSCGEVA